MGVNIRTLDDYLIERLDLIAQDRVGTGQVGEAGVGAARAEASGSMARRISYNSVRSSAEIGATTAVRLGN